MIAAMRTALESLLQRFRPDELESRFNQGGRKSSLLAGKGRYWEMYREMFAELDQDRDSLFRDVFGDQFVRAYEAQVQLLAKSRR
jgi:type VI secretion system protein ImpI